MPPFAILDATVPVALLDSGVDVRRGGNLELDSALKLSINAAGAVEVAPARRDALGHGSACAGILRAVAPGVRIVSLAVIDEGGRGEPEVLASAVRWCVAHDVKVLNMSLGVVPSDRSRDLEAACAEAAAAGVIIVAAEHNDGLVSYPAHLPTTIGVRGGQVYGDDAYYYCPGQPIECIARGDAQRVCWLDGKDVLMEGNSFAAPRITGIVARLKASHRQAGLEGMRDLLREHAARVTEAPAAKVSVARGCGPGRSVRYPWIRRAALYPYTKEMHAFVRFRDLLPFELAGVADPPGRGQVARDAGEVIGCSDAGLQIRPRLAAAAPSADSVILGYLGQLGRLRQRDLHREHLEYALDHGLHVFSFEPLPSERYGDLHEAARHRGLHFDWPSVPREAALETLRGQPVGGAVDLPVLGVFGTSASQGKFTLQLSLRRELTAQGCQLGQVGTEHHSELFGMDLAFPMGYASTIDLDLALYPEYLDRKMREICWRRRPDLIVVGSQSGTVPFDLNDRRTLSLPSLAFLLGTKPDACVLVVNAIDPEDYIEDTISGLRALGQSAVIALALSGRVKDVRTRHGRAWTSYRRAGEPELEETLRRLERRFRLPAVAISSRTGVQRLCSTIVEYFRTPDQQEEDTCSRKRA